MKPVHTDVAVVGAGPAGAVLAYLLARSGVRTVLLEQHRMLERQFRGYFLQPSVLRLFDEMGLLEKVLAFPHQKVDAFHFVDHGKRLFSVRFDDLPRPYNFGLNLPQPPLLDLLVREASACPGVSFLSGTMAQDLLRENGQVAGLLARDGGGQLEIRARLVVGADGRYSKVRNLSGIKTRGEDPAFDFLWFDMPPLQGVQFPVQVSITPSGTLIYIPVGQTLQIGWVIPKDTYKEVRLRGLADLKRRIGAADPRLSQWVDENLTDFRQCSLLSVEVNMVEQWTQDGLLLIGDAAHVVSPFSGQGNSLAIQDAVVAHAVIVESLQGHAGILGAESLAAVEQRRRPAVDGTPGEPHPIVPAHAQPHRPGSRGGPRSHPVSPGNRGLGGGYKTRTVVTTVLVRFRRLTEKTDRSSGGHVPALPACAWR